MFLDLLTFTRTMTLLSRILSFDYLVFVHFLNVLCSCFYISNFMNWFYLKQNISLQFYSFEDNFIDSSRINILIYLKIVNDKINNVKKKKKKFFFIIIIT